MINIILKNLAVKLEKKQDPLFNYSITRQKEYLKKFKKPKNDLERSYFQYKCQMKLKGIIITILLNILSLPLIVYYLFLLLKKDKILIEKKDAIFFRDGKPKNILPSSLEKEFKTIEFSPREDFILELKDLKFILYILKKYPFSWHFILKVIMKIAKYRMVINLYNPKAIIVCAEYSFTSSILTYFCNQNKIEHINVMHGEKLFYIRDTFFRFNRCYIWDIYYKELFIKLKCYKKQFFIEKPLSIKFNEKENKKEYKYTYYLAGEKEDNLKEIYKNLLKLSNDKIIVRPHPRYSNLSEIKKIFIKIEIEDIKKITIEESLMRTEYAISLFSTVLTQALYNGVKICIDDISNCENYKKLKELEYICLKKEHDILSNLLKEEKKDVN